MPVLYVIGAFVLGVICGWALLKWVAGLRMTYGTYLLRFTHHRTNSQRTKTNKTLRYSQRARLRQAVRSFERGDF